jgi:MFS family permease
LLGFTGILLGIFSIGVMQLILATALPSVVAEIGGSDQYGLVFSSYLLASLASIPLFSKLADIYGKRRFYLAGMGIFGIGSLYGGLSSNMTQLIVARVVQGIGAGIIAPVALAMIAEMFPAEKRGSMIGMFGLVQLLANLLSPPLGRFITTSLGWPWIFYLNLGLVILSSLLVILGDRHPESRLSMRLSDVDILGGLLFGGFCVLTVAFANFLGKGDTREWTWVWFLAAIVITASVLVIIEIRHRNPTDSNLHP